MSHDDRTLAAYERAADRYAAAQAGPAPAVLTHLDMLRERLGAGAMVLEIGSGTGQDARLLAERGLAVTPTDATPAFVTMLRAAGLAASRLDVRYDDLGGPWDGVWANAVLLHLSRAELSDVLGRLHAAVRRGGVLCFSVKEGDGDAWSTAKLDLPRHFTFWREAGLRSVLFGCGWDDVGVAASTGRADDWLWVTARR